MRNKETSEQIQKYLQDENTTISKFSAEERIEIFIFSILLIGSKSFSHLLAVLERFLVLSFVFFFTDDVTVISLIIIFFFE
jgi:hypothetical protein